MGLKQQFRIKEGKHAFRGPDGKLKTLLKGTIVASEDDLMVKFPEKFEKVHSDDPVMDMTGGKLAEAMKLREKHSKPEPFLPPPPKVVDDPPVEEEEFHEPVIVESEEKGEEEVPAPATTPGKDVTSRFPKLGSQGLHVLFDGDNYTIKKGSKIVASDLEDKISVMKWFNKWKK